MSPGETPSIAQLEPLIGEWRIEIPPNRHGDETVEGTTSFEWLEGGGWMVQRSVTGGLYPNGVTLIGADGDPDSLAMHYFDSRGVARLLRLTLADGVLRYWRAAVDSDDFDQRFEGAFSEDGNRIDGHFDMRTSPDAEWERDFDLIYRRAES